MLFEPAFFQEVTPERATAVFPADWPIFAGHFPGRPVVPAYALVGLVLAHAERALGAPVALETLDRMKLARALAPGEPVLSELEPIAQGAVVKVRARLSSGGSEVGTVSLSARVGA